MGLHLASETDQPDARLGYRPALDGLRAVAIAAVLLYHAGGILPGGTVGVDLFFVLSGFLITTLLLEDRVSAGEASLQRFYRRRAYRLLPALVALLGAFLALSIGLALDGVGSLASDLVGIAAGVGYLSNVVMTGEPGTQVMPDALRHLWSLAAEEQFYVVWPVVFCVILRRRLRLALLVVGAGIVLMTARQVQLYVDGASWERMGFGVDTRNVSILVGCALALLLAPPARPRLDWARWLAAPAATCVVAFFLVDFGRQLFAGPLVVFALGCAALILGVLDGRSPVARVLSLGAVVFVGRISYSLYLWHFPVFVSLSVNTPGVSAAVVPALLITATLAIASYYLVERPFLNRRRERRVERKSVSDSPPSADALVAAAA